MAPNRSKGIFYGFLPFLTKARLPSRAGETPHVGRVGLGVRGDRGRRLRDGGMEVRAVPPDLRGLRGLEREGSTAREASRAPSRARRRRALGGAPGLLGGKLCFKEVAAAVGAEL